MSANFFTESDKKAIVDAIKIAEKNTSGEIRVHIESICKEKNVNEQALKIFYKLKMDKTELRNAVLFYLAVNDRKFALIGDKGIHEAVPFNFWETTKDEVLSYFKLGKFSEGLSKGIIMAGEQLKTHFPYQKDDINELSDDISFG